LRGTNTLAYLLQGCMTEKMISLTANVNVVILFSMSLTVELK